MTSPKPIDPPFHITEKAASRQPGSLPWIALRAAAALSGVALLAWAFTAAGFRNAEGSLAASACAPASAGAALLLWAASGALWRPAAWLALMLVGQAASLQWIDAGNLVRWQHYKPPARLLAETPAILLAVVAVQALVVATGIARRWPELWPWLRKNLKAWQLAALALIIFLPAAAVQRNPVDYAADLAIASLLQAVQLGNLLLLVWSIPTEALQGLRSRLERLFSPAEEAAAGRFLGIDRFAAGAAIWVVAISALLGYAAYEWHPHITDEVVYLYQARFFAGNAIALPAPPVPEAFELYLMEFQGSRWFPVTPPGWPALLSLGVRAGLPGMVNPLLGGLNILLGFYVLKELYDRRTARLATFLLAVSPWYIFMAMNFMTHMATLAFGLAAAAAVIQARKTGKNLWAWLAGCAIGAGSLVRPLDGLIVAALVGLWIIGLGGKRLRFAALVAFGVGVVMTGALVIPFNLALSGSPTRFPINAYLDSHFGPGRNSLGFGPNKGFGWPVQPFEGHSPLGAVINSNLNLFSINIEMFGWGTGSLFLAGLLLVTGRLRKSDWLMIAICLANYIPYFFYYYSGGPDFGARYWFLMILPVAALTAGGIHRLGARLDSANPASAGLGSTRVMAAVLALSLAALVTFFPWRAIDKYRHFWNMRPDMASLSQEYHFGKSLVLVRGKDSHPDYASAAIYNPLDWDAPAPVYAWDRGAEARSRLAAAFPDRPVWVVDSPSLTGAGYRVVAGPLPAGQPPNLP